MAERDDTTSGGRESEKFRAQPAGMRKYGTEFLDLADDASEAITYADTWVDFDPSGGAVFERFVDAHEPGRDTGVRLTLFKAIHAAGQWVAGAGRIMASGGPVPGALCGGRVAA